MSGGSDSAACSKHGHCHSQAAVLPAPPVQCVCVSALVSQDPGRLCWRQVKPGQAMLIARWFPLTHTGHNPLPSGHTLPPVYLCWLSPACLPQPILAASRACAITHRDPSWLCPSCGPACPPVPCQDRRCSAFAGALGPARALLASPGRAGQSGSPAPRARPITSPIARCSLGQALAASFLLSNRRALS